MDYGELGVPALIEEAVPIGVVVMALPALGHPGEQLLLVGEDELFDHRLGSEEGGADFNLAQIVDPEHDVLARSAPRQGVGDLRYFTRCFHSVTVSPMYRPDSMMLSLIQPIIYQAPPFVYQNGEDAYQSALSLLDDAPSGCEVVIALTSTARLLFVGFKGEPSQEELLAIERGEEQPQAEGDYELEAGRYEFSRWLSRFLSSILSLPSPSTGRHDHAPPEGGAFHHRPALDRSLEEGGIRRGPPCSSPPRGDRGDHRLHPEVSGDRTNVTSIVVALRCTPRRGNSVVPTGRRAG